MVPGSAQWWWTRTIWLGILALLLIPIALMLSPLERVSRAAGAPAPSMLRLLLGATLAGLGMSLSALLGFNGELLSPVSTGSLVLVLVGGLIYGVRLKLPRFGYRRRIKHTRRL